MTPLEQIAALGGLVLLGVFLLLIGGIAICSHFDAECMGGEDWDAHP